MVATSSARSGLGIETVERIVGSGGPSSDAERVEDMDRSEPTAGGVRDAGVVALRIDAEHRALSGEEVGNDGADALAGSGWGEGEEVGRSVIVQERAGLAVRLELAADDEPTSAGVARGLDLARGGEACRAVHAVVGRIGEIASVEAHDGDRGARDAAEQGEVIGGAAVEIVAVGDEAEEAGGEDSDEAAGKRADDESDAPADEERGSGEGESERVPECANGSPQGAQDRHQAIVSVSG
jgi:hypothetical protein